MNKDRTQLVDAGSLGALASFPAPFSAAFLPSRHRITFAFNNTLSPGYFLQQGVPEISSEMDGWRNI